MVPRRRASPSGAGVENTFTAATAKSSPSVAGKCACYNPPLPEEEALRMWFPRHRLACLCLLALLAAGPCCLPATAQNWTQPARELADKILGHTQSRSAIFLELKNTSSLDAADAADVRRAIEAQMRALGARLVPADQAVDDVRVTLSENAREYVWVAEIGRHDQNDVVMVSMPLLSLLRHDSAGLVSFRKTSLLTQSARILDVAVVSPSAGATSMLVLDAERLTLYEDDGGRWRSKRSVLVAHERPLPRDLRGRVVVQPSSTPPNTVQGAAYTAYLPGLQCSGNWIPELTTECHASDDPWPLINYGGADVRAFFSASRNFFTGASSGIGADPGPFYSAARISQDNSVMWFVTSVDGAAPPAPWGSDIAAVNSACGQFIVATRPGAEQTESLRLYQITGRRAVESGAPLDLPGTLTALWTAADGNSAIAIIRNAKTGEYEASTLAITCAR
jgi:hypothetical protein